MYRLAESADTKYKYIRPLVLVSSMVGTLELSTPVVDVPVDPHQIENSIHICL